MSDLEDAYRRVKARAERIEQVLITEHDHWVQAEAERDAAAESCRLMQDRVARLVEANIKLREALEIDYQAMKYPPGVTANFHIIEAIVNNRTASRKASLHTMQDKALG